MIEIAFETRDEMGRDWQKTGRIWRRCRYDIDHSRSTYCLLDESKFPWSDEPEWKAKDRPEINMDEATEDRLALLGLAQTEEEVEHELKEANNEVEATEDSEEDKSSKSEAENKADAELGERISENIEE